MAAIPADRNLLVGLLALQNGLINQVQLVAAFQAWTLDKVRALADHLISLGHLNDAQRAVVEAMADLHVAKHGDIEQSLAALPAGRSTRESLAQLGDPDIEGTLARVRSRSTQQDGEADPDRTATYSVGSATSDGRRFRVLRPHAHGGLGAVFVALDTELHREVALKQILDQHADDPVSRARFLLEAEVTGGLEHPGIVPVYGMGTYGDGRPYYAMRFIRGDALKEAIDQFHTRRKGTAVSAGTDSGAGAGGMNTSVSAGTARTTTGSNDLALRKLLRHFLDVCNAIEYAHSRGVLHRDIKPSNTIVGKHGETLVVDWGLAKATGKSDPAGGERTLAPSSGSGSAETLPGSALGTPAYMSPEQAEGDLEHLGPRSDVYSLGATLYYLLTGRPPFEGDAVDVIPRVQCGDFRRPRAVDPSIHRALEAVCLKAMAPRQADRYGSCRELAEDVERWMADEPVTAWREPPALRLKRWARRNRTAVTTLAVAMLVALVGTGAVLAVQTRANRHLRAVNTDLAIAQVHVSKANNDLTSANQRERQRFDLAVEAIRRYYTDVSEDFLLKQDQFKDLRDRLLHSATEFYGKLSAMLGQESDLASRRALAQAQFDVADLTARVGHKEAALAAHRRVLADREKLAAEVRSDADSRFDVARSLTAFGRLLAETGQTAEGLAAYDRAQRILRKLADDHPTVVRYRDELARAYHYQGDLSWSVGRYAEAAEAHGQARVIWEALADADPSVARFRTDQARSDLYAGVNLSYMGHKADALAAYERARAILRRLADAHPTVTQFQRDLANCLGHIGELKLDVGKRAEAFVEFHAELAIEQKLVAASPAVTDFQRQLESTHEDLGRLLDREGHRNEALAEFRAALAIIQKLAADNPTVVDFRSRLANCLARIGKLQQAVGRTTEAADAYRKAVAIMERLPPTPVNTYDLACFHALLFGVAGRPASGLTAAEGQTEEYQAMHFLREAVAAGYRQLAWMRNDSDLDPLRSRPGFQLLMMDLAFPAEPFARRD